MQIEPIIYGLVSLVLLVILYLVKKKISNSSKEPSYFYKKVENGYAKLVTLLYYNNGNRNEKNLKREINQIIYEKQDGRYVGGYTKRGKELDFFSFSIDIFDDIMRIQKDDFILELNDNIDVYKVKNVLEKSLKEILPSNFFNENLDNETLPSFLAYYTKKLKKKSIQVAFFYDAASTAYLIIFPKSKEKIIKQAILDIGFKYSKEMIINE